MKPNKAPAGVTVAAGRGILQIWNGCVENGGSLACLQ